MQIRNAIDMIQQALTGLPVGSEVHRDAISAVRTLSRHMPQGTPVAGAQQTQLQDMLRNTVRNALLQRVMAMQALGGGEQQQPSQPSMPIPGS